MTVSKDFSGLYGPWAVVTGASAGMGAEFARQLAATGISVAIVARRIEMLEELSETIKKECKVDVKVIQADLLTEAGRQTVLEETAHLDVGLIVNNAGLEVYGPFIEGDLSDHIRLIELNITVPTALTHEYGQRFVSRTRADASGKRRAGIIMVSSILNTGVPTFSTYSASKAYATALAVSVRAELEGDRVDVFSLEPGPFASEMNKRLVKVVDFAALGYEVMPVHDCVEQCLEAFDKRESSCSPKLLV